MFKAKRPAVEGNHVEIEGDEVQQKLLELRLNRGIEEVRRILEAMSSKQKQEVLAKYPGLDKLDDSQTENK